MARPKGIPMTEEYKRWKSETTKGKNNPFYGQKHSTETKSKLKKAWIKRKLIGFSDETKEKIKKNHTKYWMGKKRDVNTLLKMIQKRNVYPYIILKH